MKTKRIILTLTYICSFLFASVKKKMLNYFEAHCCYLKIKIGTIIIVKKIPAKLYKT